MKLTVDGSPFHRLIGLELVRAEEGEVEMRLGWREEFRRADGSDWYHGGIISALIDIAGDYAIASRLGRWVPTIDLRVDYLRPAREGTLTAVARAVKVGRTVGVADIELRDAKGAVVAIGRCAYSTSG
ncbi:MAG: PaaI family thioesterase [Candidatus Rokubacteria bacterium]|nr:PaaI family thioesterase [Candidatus Rokubacteria bacterium]